MTTTTRTTPQSERPSVALHVVPKVSDEAPEGRESTTEGTGQTAAPVAGTRSFDPLSVLRSTRPTSGRLRLLGLVRALSFAVALVAVLRADSLVKSPLDVVLAPLGVSIVLVLLIGAAVLVCSLALLVVGPLRWKMRLWSPTVAAVVAGATSIGVTALWTMLAEVDGRVDVSVTRSSGGVVTWTASVLALAIMLVVAWHAVMGGLRMGEVDERLRPATFALAGTAMLAIALVGQGRPGSTGLRGVDVVLALVPIALSALELHLMLRDRRKHTDTLSLNEPLGF